MSKTSFILSLIIFKHEKKIFEKIFSIIYIFLIFVEEKFYKIRIWDIFLLYIFTEKTIWSEQKRLLNFMNKILLNLKQK